MTTTDTRTRYGIAPLSRYGFEPWLPEADLRGADLRGQDISGAALFRADLRGADLRGAVLQRAALDGADLRGARLDGADLRGATLGDHYTGAVTLGDLSAADVRYCVQQAGGACLTDEQLRRLNLRREQLNNPGRPKRCRCRVCKERNPNL